MPYGAKILLDSLSPAGTRLTTFEISIPKFLLAELNTHRDLSRNAASSRAIPTKKMIELVLKDPVLPTWWGKNQAGMQAFESLEKEAIDKANFEWFESLFNSVDSARTLAELNVHKQIVNRIIEPYMFAKVIVSGTNWTNFFSLRCTKHAQPEFKKIAIMMLELYQNSTPIKLKDGEWHIPLIGPEDIEAASFLTDVKEEGEEMIRKAAVGRAARVSYLTHDGKRDLMKDIELHDRLLTDKHMSPFEHVAMAIKEPVRHGNFVGFIQYRKRLPEEYINDLPRKCDKCLDYSNIPEGQSSCRECLLILNV